MKTKSILRRNEAWSGFLFTLPAILGMTVFFLIPFALSVYISMTTGLNSTKFVGLKNYAEMLQNSTFQLAAWNTLRFILIAVPLIMIISLLIALLLYRRLRGHEFFRAAFIFPLVLPVASIILFFQIIFNQGGLINKVLSLIHVAPTDWLFSSHAFAVLVILYIWKNCGYNIILFLAALNSVPKEYYEAADLDTANGWTKLSRITLPLISQPMFFILIISITNTFKSFREAYILFRSYPNKTIYMIQHFINNNFQNANYLRVATSAILIFLLIFVLVFVLLWIKNKKGGDLGS